MYMKRLDTLVRHAGTQTFPSFEKEARMGMGSGRCRLEMAVGVINVFALSERFCCGAAPRTPRRSFHSHVRRWGGRPMWCEGGGSFQSLPVGREGWVWAGRTISPSSRGFCFFNSVAIACRQLQQQGKASKILIVDWVGPGSWCHRTHA